MKIHTFIGFLVILLGFVFQLQRWEWSVILLCILMVLTLEIINTVVEKYLDFYHANYSLKVKFLKDTAAGAVLLAAVFSVIIGGIIFIPKCIQLF